MQYHLITGNKNKFKEVKAILPTVKQLDIDLPEIQEIDPKKVVKAKLGEAFNHQKGNLIIEDTSLYLDCLNGFPGPLIKWLLGTIGNEGIYQLTRKYKNPKAEVKTIVGFAKSPKDIHYFTGSLKGTIVRPKAKTTFGWDPIFKPKNAKVSFAEMTREEKNKISMRRIAFDKLQKFLNK